MSAPHIPDDSRRPDAAPSTTGGDGSILDLLRLAGHRPQPAADRAEQAFAAVEQEWRRAVRLRRLRRSLWRLGAVAAAATVAVAAGAVWMAQRAAVARAARPAPAIVATLLALHGPVRGHGPLDGTRPPVRAGDGLTAGAALDSGPHGRAVLRLAGGASVRLDQETRVSIDGAESLTLDRGAIYIDSQAPRGAHQLRVRTPHGLVRDIGTQFEVRTSDAEIRIRVREGEVRLDRGAAASRNPSAATAVSPVPQGSSLPATELQVTAAEELRVASSGAVARRPMPTRGPEWAWIETIAPPFTIEGAPLDRFLAWVSREQGWRWRYADEAATRYGATVVLHGSIEGLTPAQALDAVLATCHMSSRVRDGQLTVFLVAN